MRLFALSAPRGLLTATAAAVFLSLTSLPSHAQDDPPAQVGRISYISGNVSVQPAGVDGWGEAIPNLPLGPGGRIYTDSNSRAEVQIGQNFVRIGPNSDVSLVESSPDNLVFGVATGSIHVRSNGIWNGQMFWVQTPNGSSGFGGPGEIRTDVMPDQDATLFTAYVNNVKIIGAGFEQLIGSGRALELIGSNPVIPQWFETANRDDLDSWSQQRDQMIMQAQSYQYVSPEIPGAYELDAAGSWQPGTPYGAVWFPNSVEAGWAPYHNGHWVNRSPWGWVWVENESWGYAPFHYGRWISFNGRWGWVPGPPAAHPVWSPALVVFAGGIHFGGASVSAWFPLGPGEPYRPWYPCSPHYVDQVNITNITEAPRVHVQTTYVNINVVNVTYVNRTIGVTAISHEDFAAGRPANQVAVKVDVNLFEHVQPLAAPEPKPTQESFVGHSPAHAVPVSTARPVLINREGKAVSAAPGAKPMEPPVKPTPVVKPLPGHVAAAPPANATRPQQPAPGKPAEAGRPAAPAAMEAKPAPSAPEKTAPVPAKAAPPVPSKAPPATANKPAAPAPAAPKTATPPAPNKPVTAPPAAAKPPVPAPNGVKPGTTTPPAKTDKDKKNDKDKDKDKPKEPADKPTS